MTKEKNSVSLEHLAGALAYAMGIEPPIHAEEANATLRSYVDTVLQGTKVDRIFMYNTDAIGQWVYEKYPHFSDVARTRTDLELPMLSPNPPKTPVCFGTMYTGAPPKVHGIEVYEKKLITADTLFDAMVRAGKRVALLSRENYSMAIIFQNRPIDYFLFSNWPDVNAKAAELILKDEYDFILCYNAHFDDIMHKYGPESAEALAEFRFNCETYGMFDAMIQSHWKHHNTLLGFGMDHGCHTREDGRGIHCNDSFEDRNILHLYKIHPAVK